MALVSLVPAVLPLPPTHSLQAPHQLPRSYHSSESRHQAEAQEWRLSLGVPGQSGYVDGILVPVLVIELARAVAG